MGGRPFPSTHDTHEPVNERQLALRANSFSVFLASMTPRRSATRSSRTRHHERKAARDVSAADFGCSCVIIALSIQRLEDLCSDHARRYCDG